MISVIVPVYKVEKYLCRCVDSLLAQTYGELEIILVDDGSPDECGRICEEYAARDPRVRVIHRTNGGLSAARNSGLEAAHGEFVGFVDSDDYLLPSMYEKLMDSLLRADADLAVCGYRSVEEDETGPCIFENTPWSGTGAEFLRENPVENNFVWNRLYRRALFEGLQFPVGKHFEDIYITGLLASRARRVAVVPDAEYCYRLRGGSITHTMSRAACLDYGEASLQRLELQLSVDSTADTVFFWAYRYALFHRKARENALHRDAEGRRGMRVLARRFRKLCPNILERKLNRKQSLAVAILYLCPGVFFSLRSLMKPEKKGK